MSKSYSRDLMIDRACDAFEARFRTEGTCPDLEAFIDSVVKEADETPVDVGWRNELAVELIRLQLALSDSSGLPISVESLKHAYPRLASQIDSAIRNNEARETATGVAIFENAVNETLKPGQSIGPFELVSHLGMGGMGTVWKACQLQPVQRQVALKFVRNRMASPHLLARFRSERQALAVLNHPNIAKMLDASATEDGLPYFVMELVDGPSLVVHAAAENLSIRQKIELFLPVCQAIQHAHQKGIIHRDLKPSNILVATESGASLAKVIDFGLAKAIETPLTDEWMHTVSGQILGTPDYMSPEQTRLGQTDIDTRTDIYSLGAVLYELLTGSRPFQERELHKHDLERTLEIIRNDDPMRPGKRNNTAGTGKRKEWDELDWIVLKCLEKDRSRRYESAAALGQDLQRFLDGEPVEAAPPSRSYRVRKFVSRNRGLVIAGSVSTTILVLGLAGTLIGWNVAINATNRAVNAQTESDNRANKLSQALGDLRIAEQQSHRRSTELEKIVRFQQQQVQELNTATTGPVLRSELLDQYRSTLEHLQLDPAGIESRMKAFGDQLEPLNFTDVAAVALRNSVFEPSLESINRDFADEPLLRAKLLRSLAASLDNAGMGQLAESSQETAVRILRTELGEQSEDHILALSELGRIILAYENSEEAFSMLGTAVELAEQNLDPNEDTAIKVLLNYSVGLHSKRRLVEAEVLLRMILTRSILLKGDEHAETLKIKQTLGHVIYSARKYSEAEQIFRDLVGSQRQASDIRLLNMSLIQLAQALQAQDPGIENPEVLQVLNEAYELTLNEHGKNHPLTLRSYLYLAESECFIGDAAKGDWMLQDCIEQYRQFHGEFHEFTMSVENTHAGRVWSLGRHQESAELLEQLLTKAERAGLSSTPIGIRIRHFAARSYRSLKRNKDALEQLQIALGDQSEADDLSYLRSEIFENLYELGRNDEARQLALDHVGISRKRFNEGTLDRCFDLAVGAKWLMRLECHKEATPVLRECLEIRQHLEPEHLKTIELQSDLGECLVKLGQLKEAESMLIAAHEGLEKCPGQDSDDFQSSRQIMIHRLIELYQLEKNDQKSREWQERLNEKPVSIASDKKP